MQLEELFNELYGRVNYIKTTNNYYQPFSHSLQLALEKERKRKAGLLSTWTLQSSELKKKLRELEKKGEFSNTDSKEQLQDVIAKLKVSSQYYFFDKTMLNKR